MSAASASAPEAGESELLMQTVAVFTNNNVPYGGAAYYDTNGSNTDYNFLFGMGFGLGADFEAGFNAGYGQLSGSICNGRACSTPTVDGRQWSLFLRHNFRTGPDNANFAFSGLEYSAVYPQSRFGRVTVLRPYVGYRFGLPQDWGLELLVGGSQVVSGTAQVSSGYEVRAGLVIPLY